MLVEEIKKRASIRKYQDESLDINTISQIKKLIEQQKPLFNNINYQIDLVLDGKSFQKVLGGIVGSYGKIYAPHYLVVSTEIKENSYENIGYILEYIVLKLTSMNIGTCWIGGGIKKNLFKDYLNLNNNLTPIIVIAFGLPLKMSMFRNNLTQFKRKAISDICTGQLNDKLITVFELVRLAPSAINSQPWRFDIFENIIDVYKVKNKVIMKNILDDLNKIDIGIALAHLEIGLNKPLCLSYKNKHKANLDYFCTIE